jgi:GntR family transcriptional regulator, transcriptional repressor for pyruvate dehydrogenase complex
VGNTGTGSHGVVRPLQRPRLYEQLVERLLDHIESARLGPGDRLPPERELAPQLGVSRASLSQALVALEVEGLVDVRHGDGAVVVRSASRQQVLAALRARKHLLPDVLEARSALEVKLAGLAALRRSDDDLAAMEDALVLMDEDIRAGGRGLEGDERFHRAVTTAARSALLADLMKEIALMIKESRVESLSQPGRPARSLAGHREILAAIHRRDARGAASAMWEHIELVSDVALLRDGR